MMVIIFRPPIDQMPDVVHFVITVLAGYAGIGFLLNFKKVNFRNLPDKIVYVIILFHLITSSLVHAYSIIWKTNNWLNFFHPVYNYFALVYFAAFAFYCFKLDKGVGKI